MFFHKNPVWGIVFRILLVVLLIGGVFAITRGAFYRGYAVGVGARGADLSRFSHDPGDMMFSNQRGVTPFYGYPGGMDFHSRGGFGVGIWHILFGLLGLFLLVKFIMGFSYMSMYSRWDKHGDPEGKGYRMVPPWFHSPYYWHHQRYHDECCCDDEKEEAAQEPAAPEKPKKKKS